MIKLLIGDVPLLQDRALARIRKEQEDREAESFFGPDCNARALQEACINLTLLGGAPFVILRAADRLPKKVQEVLANFFKDVPRDVCLVILADKVDRRLKFWQQLIPLAEVISVEAPPPRERRAWLNKEFRHRALQVSADAFEILLESGENFNQLLLLLERLELYLGECKKVTLEAAEACSQGGSPVKIFEWAEAVGAEQWGRALLILQSLWSGREAPLAILALLVRHYRILLKAAENQPLWGRPQELARILGVPPFTVDKYVQQAKKYSREDLMAFWQELQATDRRLKSSPSKKEWEIEQLLLNLRRQRRQLAI